MKAYRFSVLLFFAQVALAAEPLPEASPSVTPIEVNEVVVEVQKNRESINENDQQKRKILSSLYDISRRMKKITFEKGEMTDKLIRTQGSVKFIAKDIVGLQKKVAAEQTQLKKTLRNLYKMSGETYVAILFSQESAVSLDRSMKFFKIISEKDFALIKLYEKNIANLRTKKSNLNTQVKKLMSIEGDIKKQESLLVIEHSQKSKIVSEIENRKLVNVETIKKLRTQAQEKKLTRFDAALSDLLKTAFYENKGMLPAPIAGTITQDFGLMKHEEFPVEFSHKGWRYSSTKDASVSAVYDGRVSYKGNIEGYGETIIIDHGDHYYSVYAHLSQVKVKQDELVKKSQIMATAGSTSSANSVGIYFEIRHFSEPENPKNWISPQEIKVSLE